MGFFFFYKSHELCEIFNKIINKFQIKWFQLNSTRRHSLCLQYNLINIIYLTEFNTISTSWNYFAGKKKNIVIQILSQPPDGYILPNQIPAIAERPSYAPVTAACTFELNFVPAAYAFSLRARILAYVK